LSREKPLQGWNDFFNLIPGFSLRSNPGLKLANAFGVLSDRRHEMNDRRHEMEVKQDRQN
jgi:hypothetical protein